MKLLVLLVAFVFTATVHADYNRPLVLVAKVNGEFHPLSPLKKVSDSFDNELEWGNLVAVPPEFTPEGSNGQLYTHYRSRKKYVVFKDGKLFISLNKDNKNVLQFNDESKLVNHKLISCKSQAYNSLLKAKGALAKKCEKAEIYLLPFYNETRSVVLPGNGPDVKTKTSLSVPPNHPRALFAYDSGTWCPLTIVYSGPNESSYEMICSMRLNFPVEFERDIQGQEEHLVSMHKDIQGYACFEGILASLKKEPCAEQVTLDNNNKVVGKEVYVCDFGQVYLSKYHLDCRPVDIYLLHYDRTTNSPVWDTSVSKLLLGPGPPITGNDSHQLRR